MENAEHLLKAGRPLVVSEDRCRKCFVESAAAGIKVRCSYVIFLYVIILRNRFHRLQIKLDFQ